MLRALRNRTTVIVEVATTRCVEACLRRQRTALLLSRRRSGGRFDMLFFITTAKRVGDSLQKTHRAALFLHMAGRLRAVIHLGLNNRWEILDLRHADRFHDGFAVDRFLLNRLCHARCWLLRHLLHKTTRTHVDKMS